MRTVVLIGSVRSLLIQGALSFLGYSVLRLQQEAHKFTAIETTGVWAENVGSLVADNDTKEGGVGGGENDEPPATSKPKQQQSMKRVKVVYRWRRIVDPDAPFVIVLRTFEPVQETDLKPLRQLVELSKSYKLNLFPRTLHCILLFSPPYRSHTKPLSQFIPHPRCTFDRSSN